MSLLCFIVIITVFIYGISKVSSRTDSQALETLQNAVSRDIVRCYAIEGVYPENLEYLKDHYGLTYDESRFVVDYQPLGQNILPDVTIIDKEAK